jgi:hypothetical protein
MRGIRVRNCRLLSARARPSCEKDDKLAALRSSLQTMLEGVVRAFSISLRGEACEPLGDGEFTHAAGSDQDGCPSGAALSNAKLKGQT